MIRSRRPRLTPAGVILGALLVALVLFSLSPSTRARPARAACQPAASVTCPTPTGAYLSLDVSAGGPDTQITVGGGAFLANEQMTLYWDVQSKVVGSATSDRDGNVVPVHVKPFAGEQPGLHRICASVAPNPCAQFTLQGSPTPTPSASPSASPDQSPSPSPSPTESPSSSPSPLAAAPTNGIDIITRPPFVFLPIIALLGVVGVIAYWAMGGNQRPRTPPLPAPSVVHRTARPEHPGPYSAPPPAAPLPAAPTTLEPEAHPPPPAGEPPPAWPVTPPASSPTPPEPVEPAPPPDVPAAPDAPPDLPEPGE